MFRQDPKHELETSPESFLSYVFFYNLCFIRYFSIVLDYFLIYNKFLCFILLFLDRFLTTS